MRGQLIAVPPQPWYCPNCALTEVTAPLPPGASRFHPCPGLHGLIAPLIRAGVRAEVRAEERADYAGREILRYGDDGIPYMAVRTVREDGEDLAVMAPVAHARLGELA